MSRADRERRSAPLQRRCRAVAAPPATLGRVEGGTVNERAVNEYGLVRIGVGPEAGTLWTDPEPRPVPDTADAPDPMPVRPRLPYPITGEGPLAVH
jgi:hypothetical protein